MHYASQVKAIDISTGTTPNRTYGGSLERHRQYLPNGVFTTDGAKKLVYGRPVHWYYYSSAKRQQAGGRARRAREAHRPSGARARRRTLPRSGGNPDDVTSL